MKLASQSNSNDQSQPKQTTNLDREFVITNFVDLIEGYI